MCVINNDNDEIMMYYFIICYMVRMLINSNKILGELSIITAFLQVGKLRVKAV